MESDIALLALTQPAHLNTALAQSGWTGPRLTPENWCGLARQRVAVLDWKENVMRDLRAFIIDLVSLSIFVPGLNPMQTPSARSHPWLLD